MLYGLYLSAQGAQVQTLRQDVISNNLANANTAGFKRDLVRAQAFAQFDVDHHRPQNPALKDLPGGTLPSDVATDYSQAALNRTGNPLDLAIAGRGFIAVRSGRDQALTRDGQLAVTAQGQLVTRNSNLPVLGLGGNPIQGLDPDQPLTIDPSGRLLQNGNAVGQLALVEPTNYGDLAKLGQNLYRAPRSLKPAPAETIVSAGMLEASGVQPVKEMTELIEASRVMESNINLIRAQDESLGRLLQSVSRR